ncbi:hypothetical protein RUM43_000941 [Polyplax serrata]|uniref:Uncharacterized protein n=1 Tax=Polyplax serrata TaxID=468196 RepID=A0AAN8SD33_POLSC
MEVELRMWTFFRVTTRGVTSYSEPLSVSLKIKITTKKEKKRKTVLQEESIANSISNREINEKKARRYTRDQDFKLATLKGRRPVSKEMHCEVTETGAEGQRTPDGRRHPDRHRHSDPVSKEVRKKTKWTLTPGDDGGKDDEN